MWAAPIPWSKYTTCSIASWKIINYAWMAKLCDNDLSKTCQKIIKLTINTFVFFIWWCESLIFCSFQQKMYQVNGPFCFQNNCVCLNTRNGLQKNKEKLLLVPLRELKESVWSQNKKYLGGANTWCLKSF